MKVANKLVKANGKVRILGRKAASQNLRDTKLFLNDAYKLLRKKELEPLEFEALEARLQGALMTLTIACGALGIAIDVEGL